MRNAIFLSFAWLCTCCTTAVVIAAGPEDHWAFRPLGGVSEVAPEGDLDAAAAIDERIERLLRERELSAAPLAEPATLLRRLTFVLTGLPPSLDQQRQFEADPSPEAYRALVDQMLDSHEFAERWGRHWLDIARFAESSGGGRSIMFPEAWRYRDYVIDAFDRDLPFDRFIVEQLAGDQLPANSPDERDRQQIATGFLVLGAINYELQDKALLDMEVADEQIEAIGRAFLGMSLGCARCHDHKFDPVTQLDYYRLAGFFTSTKSVRHDNVGSPNMVPLKMAPEVEAYRQHSERVAQLREKLESLKAEKNVDLSKEIDALKAEIQIAKKSAPRQPMAMSVRDGDEVGDTHVRLGGDVDLLGEIAPRGFPAIANPRQASCKIPQGQSGRLQLAEWIASPENRLTTRVIVNRVWHFTMGKGLVRTPDDFGTTGLPPTHPELLDYLARQFTEQGWSIKTLVRQLVLTDTFRRSTVAPDQTMAIDPENRFLARAHLRHLDAEALRDAMLAVSDQLDVTRGGPTIRKLTEYDYGYQFDSKRRSVYVPRFRSEQLDAFSVFDCANPNVVTGRRQQTILPAQALFMLNSPLTIESSTATAELVLFENVGEGPDVDTNRIETLFRRVLNRAPTAEEGRLAEAYLRDARRAPDFTDQSVYAGLCQMLFASIDFRFIR